MKRRASPRPNPSSLEFPTDPDERVRRTQLGDLYYWGMAEARSHLLAIQRDGAGRVYRAEVRAAWLRASAACVRNLLRALLAAEALEAHWDTQLVLTASDLPAHPEHHPRAKFDGRRRTLAKLAKRAALWLEARAAENAQRHNFKDGEPYPKGTFARADQDLVLALTACDKGIHEMNQAQAQSAATPLDARGRQPFHMPGFDVARKEAHGALYWLGRYWNTLGLKRIGDFIGHADTTPAMQKYHRKVAAEVTAQYAAKQVIADQKRAQALELQRIRGRHAREQKVRDAEACAQKAQAPVPAPGARKVRVRTPDQPDDRGSNWPPYHWVLTLTKATDPSRLPLMFQHASFAHRKSPQGNPLYRLGRPFCLGYDAVTQQLVGTAPELSLGEAVEVTGLLNAAVATLFPKGLPRANPTPVGLRGWVE